MGLEDYALYQEYKMLNPEQQHFVRRALSSVFSVPAMQRRNERTAAHNPTYRTNQYMLADALAGNDFVERGIQSERGAEFMDDFFSLAEEDGKRSVYDLSVAFIQELITAHETHAGTDEADQDSIGAELIAAGEPAEDVEKALDRSLELYAEDVRDTLTALQRLFPDIYQKIVPRLPEMRRESERILGKLAAEYPKIMNYQIPKKGKPTLH